MKNKGLAHDSKMILAINISLGDYATFVSKLLTLAENNISSYTCVANVHMLIEAYEDPIFAHVVNSADLVTPDGMPLVKGIKLLYGIRQDRVAGMDLLPDILAASQKQALNIYFYGGTPGMQDVTRAFVTNHYPTLSVVGYHSPPFRPLTLDEETQIIKTINDSGAHFVMVALGCPKQEKWMASMKGRIHACMIGIGGALPVMIGMQKRAPKWMQDMSLEWLYRLGQEPGRLWKRYFYTNSLFILLFVKEYITTRMYPKSPVH